MNVFHRRCLLGGLIFVLFNGFSTVSAQVPAFPGAEGFGAMTTGGRGGSVIQVTNLNDSGAGSLRTAINSSSTRTIVFRVSGTINLQSELRITQDNITIAGQTAPGDGICIRNYPLVVDANNVIIRFIRSRHGDTSGSEQDAMWGREDENIIIDHCTMSWSVDECGSFYDNKNFTMQYCLLSESLFHSIHEKGEHGYAGMWGGQGTTFHHNLLAHHSSRTPRFNGSRYSGEPALEKVDHRNNVIYNWGFNSCYGGEAGNQNMVANYYKPGPATGFSVKDRILEPYKNENGYGYYYIDGNVVEGYPETTEDNWRGVDGLTSQEKDQVRLTTPLDAPAVTSHTAYEAFEHVIAKAGAVIPKRDATDSRIVHETVSGTAQFGGEFGDSKGIIDSQSAVGGWITLESETPPDDTDKDGMPDEWEDARGLDKNNPGDRNGDQNGNGYTNLEDYLNELVEAYEYILRPIHLAVDTVVNYAVTLTWQDISDNETGFVIERNDGDTWGEVATTSADETSYTDHSLSSNGLYYYRIKSVNANLESFYTDSVSARLAVGVNTPGAGLPDLKIYPNPFTERADLKYSLQESAQVEITLYDLTGREILQLENALQSPGDYTYTIEGERLVNGIYLVRLATGNSVILRKVVLSR